MRVAYRQQHLRKGNQRDGGDDTLLSVEINNGCSEDQSQEHVPNRNLSQIP